MTTTGLGLRFRFCNSLCVLNTFDCREVFPHYQKYHEVWSPNECRRYRLRYLCDRVSECKCVEPNSLWRWIVIRRISQTQQLHWETRHCGPDIDANAFHASAGTSSRRRYRRHSDANSTTSTESRVRIDKIELLESRSNEDNHITQDKKSDTRNVYDKYKFFILSTRLTMDVAWKPNVK